VSWADSFSRDTEAVGAWHAGHGDPGWAQRRARISGLLAEADRLGALVELVGAAALPARERVVLLGGRLLREAVLQQSALSPIDAFSPAERTAALTGAVLDVVDDCQVLADRGVPAAVIEEQDFSPLLRAREEADGAAEVAARRDTMLTRLGALP
jgi:V/A-type H+-transporting ATPase subunit A